MVTINEKTILQFHEKCIEKFGGSHGVLNKDTLSYCLETHKHTFYGEELYPTLLDKIAITCFCLIKNHPFRDGNKRIGVIVMLGLCRKNGVDIKVTEQELIQFALDVATDVIKKDGIVDWMKEHIINLN